MGKRGAVRGAAARRLRALALASALLFLLPAALFAAPFRFLAIGDIPQTADYDGRFLNLVAAANSEPFAFVVHVGDFKSGTSRCSDETYHRIAGLFSAFDHPLVYTPGDNEWTDCHRLLCGGYDPVERLARLRELFFPAGQALGGRPMPVESQGGAGGEFAAYVENLRWEREGIQFATLHVVGSGNNRRAPEFAGRNGANLAWLRETFALARGRRAPGVALFMQADPLFEASPARRKGFEDLIEALAAEARAFSGPVLLVHGDSHRFHVDRPLSGLGAPDLLRVIVFGGSDVHGVRVSVDPASSGVFSPSQFVVWKNTFEASPEGR